MGVDRTKSKIIFTSQKETQFLKGTKHDYLVVD